MPSQLLSTIAGGGGGFVSKFASTTILVPTGSTGTLATLTPPAGQKVKLTGLCASTLQSNLITVTVGGNTVVNSVTLEQSTNVPNQNGDFKIGFTGSAQEPIQGDIGEVIEITTNVATSSNTLYSYQFGV